MVSHVSGASHLAVRPMKFKHSHVVDKVDHLMVEGETGGECGWYEI